jgi:hypothetical protein
MLMNVLSLKDGFGLLAEREDNTCFISLIFLDFYEHTFQILHTVTYSSNYINIFVNKADPATFILRYPVDNDSSTRICKIVEKKIIIGDVIEIDFSLNCFYGKYIYGLKWRYEDGKAMPVKLIYKCLVNALSFSDTSN